MLNIKYNFMLILYSSVHFSVSDEYFIENRRYSETLSRLHKRDLSTYDLDFNNETGLLTLIFSNSTRKDFNITLHRHLDSKYINEENCPKDYRFTNVEEIGRKLIDLEDKVEFENVETGCYNIQTDGIGSFFWVNSKIKHTSQWNWNTTILMKSSDKKSSIEVKWNWPPDPPNPNFEIASWRIILYHSKEVNILCDDNDINNHLDDANTTTPRTIIYNTTDGRAQTVQIENLSEGYNCIFLFPRSDVFSDGEGPPLGSRTEQIIQDSPEILSTPSPEIERFYPVALLAGIAAGFLFILVSVLTIYTCKRFSKRASHADPYDAVPDDYPMMDRTSSSVLLVWTNFTPEKAIDVTPAITAFKKLLSAYIGCDIFDYKDLLDMSVDERQLFHANPTEWLDHHVLEGKDKIILVGSEGSRLLQKYKMDLQMDSSELDQDDLLFVYLLRRLKSNPFISQNYSRIFHVTFPEVCGPLCNLEGMVPRMRYSIPEHIQRLKINILGLSEKEGNKLKNPQKSDLDDFKLKLQQVLHDSKFHSYSKSNQ